MADRELVRELREGGGGTGLAVEATSGPEDSRLRCQGSGKCRLPHGERVGAGDRESGLGAGCFSSSRFPNRQGVSHDAICRSFTIYKR